MSLGRTLSELHKKEMEVPQFEIRFHIEIISKQDEFNVSNKTRDTDTDG